jgi:hypothetical protein
MGKRRSIENKVKLQVINWIEENSSTPTSACRHFSRTYGWDYDDSCYRQWWRNRENIKKG